MRKLTAILFVGLLAVAACSTDPEEDSSNETTTTSEADEPSETSAPESDDPRAPGVTDDTIRVGVTYPDLANLKDLIGIDHGDYEVAYQAVADGLNAQGGIAGRQIELVFAPVDPQASDGATSACTKLAQDEEVFVAVGFFLGDEVNCFIDANEVPVIGGEITDQRTERAKVAWFNVSPGDEVQNLGALLSEGVVSDGVGVIGAEADQNLFDSAFQQQLEEADIEVIGPAYVDTSSGDANIVNGAVDNVLDRFEAEGVEQILLIGSGTGIFVGPRVAARDYAPQLVFSSLQGAVGYVSAEGADLAAADGAVSGGGFDSNSEYDTVDNQATEECLGFLEEAGHEVRPSDEVPEGEPDNIVSGMRACQDLYLLAAIVDAAGDDLDYGTFRAAGYGLGEVELPGLPDPASYGPPPSHDGDVTSYVYDFDPSTSNFVRRDA